MVLRLHLEADPGDQTPTAQVLCGVLFLGPGVEAMAASVAVPGCGMTGDWIVLRYQGGSWQLVFESHNGAVIAAVGSDVKETQNVLRPSDPHCFPTGGTRSRVWHWNDSRLVSNGPWRYSKPQAKPPSKPSTTSVFFYSPSRNLACAIQLTQGRTAFCLSQSPEHTVSLSANGALDICRHSNAARSCTANFDEFAKFKQLDYGKSISAGGFRCISEQSGITCTVAATGKGFLIAKDGVRPVGP